MGVDFGGYLRQGSTLTSAPTLVASVSLGTDPSPQSRIIGGPTIGTIPSNEGGTGLANTAILWQIDQCLAGVTYVIDIYCPSSDGDVVEASTRFSCVPAS